MWSKGLLLACLLPAVAQAQSILTVIHPAEGQSLPALKEVFVYGEVTPGSTLTINGNMVPVHPEGGYLTMVSLSSGPFTLSCDALLPSGEKLHLDRRVVVSPGFVESPVNPLTLQKETIEPSEDMILAPGDPLRVTFQGSPQASAEFGVEGITHHTPMAERMASNNSTATARGVYEGSYILQPDDKADRAFIDVTLKGPRGKTLHEKARGRLTIDNGAVPRVGLVLDEVAAVRTGSDGGYDMFLYRGMRVRMTGKVRNQRRVRLSSNQSGWVKESSLQEMPRGTPAARSALNNIIISRLDESTLIRVPLEDVLPYRVDQSLDPMQLVVTLYGAVDKTDLIRYDVRDTLIHQVRWRQINPETCQIIIEPKFRKWAGYDVRYEDNTLVIEVRKPWTGKNLKGMSIAVDAGHGGPELGAMGPHGVLEKDVNLMIARGVRDALEGAGARVIMTRDSDMDVPLYERSRIAWRNRAQLFVSIHCNSSGVGENPLNNNGYSLYWYHPQSLALAHAVHAQYGVYTPLRDRGLFYSDFAVNRMTQMPAILTEQAYIIIPEQEQLLLTPEFQQSIARAIVNGIKNYLEK